MSTKKIINPEVPADFVPPSKAFVREVMMPFNFYFAPKFLGINNIDGSKPALYVSNHTVYGILDGTPFASELYLKKNVFLRSLVDDAHFKIPYWKDLIPKYGMVRGSRENCATLMEQKQNILVFPGGAGEVCKKKGEAYQLKWKDRTGFVRMAMQYGYDIVPVAAVGAEEAFTILKDSDEILNNPLGQFIKEKVFKGGELLPPLVKGIGLSSFPRPERLYFYFGERISTKRFKKEFEDKSLQMRVRNMVEASLLIQFEELFRLREKDKDKSLWRALLTRK